MKYSDMMNLILAQLNFYNLVLAESEINGDNDIYDIVLNSIKKHSEHGVIFELNNNMVVLKGFDHRDRKSVV